MRQYISDTSLTGGGKHSYPLFPNRQGERLSRAGIKYILDKCVASARNKNPGVLPELISPHTFRHSKAMHLLHAGVNLVYIRDILGHADLKTTEIYARIDGEMKRKALEKAFTNTVPFAARTRRENLILQAREKVLVALRIGNEIRHGLFLSYQIVCVQAQASTVGGCTRGVFQRSDLKPLFWGDLAGFASVGEPACLAFAGRSFFAGPQGHFGKFSKSLLSVTNDRNIFSKSARETQLPCNQCLASNAAATLAAQNDKTRTIRG